MRVSISTWQGVRSYNMGAPDTLVYCTQTSENSKSAQWAQVPQHYLLVTPLPPIAHTKDSSTFYPAIWWFLSPPALTYPTCPQTIFANSSPFHLALGLFHQFLLPKKNTLGDVLGGKEKESKENLLASLIHHQKLPIRRIWSTENNEYHHGHSSGSGPFIPGRTTK